METENYIFLVKTFFVLGLFLLVILGFYQVLKKKNLRDGFRTYGFYTTDRKRYYKRNKR